MNMRWLLPGLSSSEPPAGTVKDFVSFISMPVAVFCVTCNCTGPASPRAPVMTMGFVPVFFSVPNAALMPESAAFAQVSDGVMRDAIVASALDVADVDVAGADDAALLESPEVPESSDEQAVSAAGAASVRRATAVRRRVRRVADVMVMFMMRSFVLGATWRRGGSHGQGNRWRRRWMRRTLRRFHGCGKRRTLGAPGPLDARRG